MYAQSLKDLDISAELHIFPDGRHGLGLALEEDAINKHVSEWAKKQLKYVDLVIEGFGEQKLAHYFDIHG